MAVVAILAALLLQGQDLGKNKEQLKSSIVRGNVAQAQAAVDGLAGAENAAAVDAMLESVGACRKEELDSFDKYKDLMDKDRKAAEEYQKHQEKLRQTSQEYSRARTPENQKKYQEAVKESKPAADEAARAHKAFDEFGLRYRSIVEIRQLVIAALSKMSGEAASKRLIERFKNCNDWMIRAGIANALESVDREDALKALLEQLKKEKEPTVKVAILDALAKRAKTDEIARAAVEEVQNRESWQVQFAALQLIRKLQLREAVEGVIEGLAKADGRLQVDFQETLMALTGVDKGILATAWRAWWDQNKESVKAGTYEPRPEEKARKAAGFTSFFGIPVVSKRVVFVLDRSGSMAQPADFDLPIETSGGKIPPELEKPKGMRKIDIARWQLKKVLYLLPDGTQFNIVFYNQAFEVFKPHLITLNPAVRQEAGAYIDALEPSGATNLFDSMERALSFARGDDGRLSKEAIDTVYLLSDGLPNRGKFTKPDDIRREVKALNANLKVAVHTVLISAGTGPGTDEALMRGLADDNDGIFRLLTRKATPGPKKMESR